MNETADISIRRGWNGWILTAIAPSIVLAVGWARRWTCDDAFIDFRVVENLAAGYGLVFNPGERVEAFTNPLWIALLFLWRCTGLRIESGAVLMGAVLSAVGVGAGIAASHRGRFATVLGFPVGALVLCACPQFRDFVTSGLETGLSFAWIGLCYWLCITERGTSSKFGWSGVALFVGAGVLVRPDFFLFMVAFAIAIVRRGRVIGTLLLVAIPGVAYEVFRMGYFAAAVSNSALAKEFASANWSQGWSYLRDFVSEGSVPFISLIAASLYLSREGLSPKKRYGELGFLFMGATHAIFIVRVGGDFMRGRLLLPFLFAFLLPVFWSPVPRNRLRQALLATAIVLSVAAAIAGLSGSAGPHLPSEAGIVDERSYYVSWAGHENPVYVEDYGNTPFVAQGIELRTLASRGARLLVIDTGLDDTTMPVSLDSAATLPLGSSTPPMTRIVAGRWAVGLVSFAAGPHVHIVDRHGVADPIGARLEVPSRGRPGHEKVLGNEWIIARFAEGSERIQIQEVVRARKALASHQLNELLDAITAPLTLSRFASNMGHAWSWSRLRIRD